MSLISHIRTLLWIDDFGDALFALFDDDVVVVLGVFVLSLFARLKEVDEFRLKIKPKILQVKYHYLSITIFKLLTFEI